ncbi:DUF6505 family protein [Oceanibaculum indicum]|uniref:Uncharacterized protein n=2 Tax=Oceanibaculum indicum TaxID=526216 RepID=K2JLV9_9PROT|nr:DUF6505 family protein [Oceanibaculum indicum]EKE76313.1 hypothetical protein P24_08189 [Oceanibaculum indicum P24]RKQ73336.1 hypothetical protein BCL74_1122 [Oceanibaculum indicum]
MLFPRTIRMDSTDTQVFEQAAESGEWAVSGSFAFADSGPGDLVGKRRVAFRSAFLGTESFGWSTFVSVSDIDTESYEAVIRRLAEHFVARYGAPSVEAALPVARSEAEFAASLAAEHRVNMLLAVEREMEEGGIRERFRALQPPREADHAKIWALVPDNE